MFKGNTPSVGCKTDKCQARAILLSYEDEKISEKDNVIKYSRKAKHRCPLGHITIVKSVVKIDPSKQKDITSNIPSKKRFHMKGFSGHKGQAERKLTKQQRNTTPKWLQNMFADWKRPGPQINGNYVHPAMTNHQRMLARRK